MTYNYKNQKGKLGEKLSEEFLIKENHKILKKNFRKNSGEIDIISEKGDTIFFIEIKNWNSQHFSPHETFTNAKIKKMRLTAERFLAEHVSFQSYLVSFSLISIEENEEVKFYSHLF